ncbi:MAG TPA: AI-2E family transporter [Lapillicoccus sp.]|nr:AI-2E family transporter [Lapillicoccus sp.]
MGVSERFGRGSALRRKGSGDPGDNGSTSDGDAPMATSESAASTEPGLVTEAAGPRRPAPVEPPHGQAQWISITPASAKRTTILVLAFIILLWVGVWAFQALGTFLFILLLAWLFSIAMEPPVLWMVRRGVRRGLATGIVLIVGLLMVAGITALFGGVFVSQVAELSQSLPETMTSVVNWFNSTFHTSFDLNNIASSIQVTPDKIGEWIGQYGGGLLGIFGSVFAFIFDFLTILVFAYYFSADSPRLRQTIGSWLPPAYQRYFVTVWEISVEKTGGYVVSKVALAALSSFFHAVFFAIIGVPYWLPLGVLAGIVGQFIPTIGTYIGVALPALFTLVSDKPINAVWIAVFATVYQQIENYIFTPRISRRTMDVHPAVALGSVIAGAALFGAVGALIGIPLAAAALAIIDTFTHRHELLPELASLEDAENRQDEEARAELERHSKARER